MHQSVPLRALVSHHRFERCRPCSRAVPRLETDQLAERLTRRLSPNVGDSQREPARALP